LEKKARKTSNAKRGAYLVFRSSLFSNILIRMCSKTVLIFKKQIFMDYFLRKYSKLDIQKPILKFILEICALF